MRLASRFGYANQIRRDRPLTAIFMNPVWPSPPPVRHGNG